MVISHVDRALDHCISLNLKRACIETSADVSTIPHLYLPAADQITAVCSLHINVADVYIAVHSPLHINVDITLHFQIPLNGANNAYIFLRGVGSVYRDPLPQQIRE